MHWRWRTLLIKTLLKPIKQRPRKSLCCIVGVEYKLLLSRRMCIKWVGTHYFKFEFNNNDNIEYEKPFCAVCQTIFLRMFHHTYTPILLILLMQFIFLLFFLFIYIWFQVIRVIYGRGVTYIFDTLAYVINIVQKVIIIIIMYTFLFFVVFKA